jgi:hypothetical protein
MHHLDEAEIWHERSPEPLGEAEDNRLAQELRSQE